MIISAFIAIASIIRPIDLAVYQNFYLKSLTNYGEQFNKSKTDEVTKAINDKIIFIDIPTTEEDGWLLKFRTDIASLLNIINSKIDTSMRELDRPAIILDIAFRSDTIGIGPVMDAVYELKIDKKLNVYAAYEMPEENLNPTFGEHDKEQNKILYDYYVTGNRLNTAFHNHLEVDGLLSYYSYEKIDTMAIESLPIRVAKDYKREESKPDSTSLDSIQYIVPLKLPFIESNREDNYFVFTNDSISKAENRISILKDINDLENKFIIIGSPGDQKLIGKEDGKKHKVPGPYIVATALIDQLNGNKFTKPPYENVYSQLALIIFFAFFVSIIFAAIYKYIRKLQTRPAIIAILSWVLGVVIFLYLGYLLLEFTIIRPTLPVISMFWAALLAWHFTKKFLVTGIMEGGEVYDVFISYSFGDSDWVKQHLFNPLNEIKKTDGSNLKIFFAENSIGIGELFTTKYMRAIVDSKFFVPVMSQEYYKKNHCRNEMDLAVKRNVEKLINLCIVALDYKYVPEEFTNINFVDVTKQTDFIPTLKKELVTGEEIQIDESVIVKQKEPDKKSEISEIKEVIPEAKKELNTQKIVLADANGEHLGKEIIIINNGKGSLTITTSGVTLTLNDKNGKKERKSNKKGSKK